MCGIAGEVRFDHRRSEIAITKAMCDAQIHRGPDDYGYYSKGPVSMGIRRLAIIDLTKGLYPLCNEEATLHLVFNGEVYGFARLRHELEQLGHRFRSQTDAETVVHGYEEWGTKCLEKMNGMFAFALWDQLCQKLWIARDHFGIKPLYYYPGVNFFLFASEIKPLLTHPEIVYAPNETVLKQYIQRGLVDTENETSFNNIYRLGPGRHMTIRPDGTMKQERYWAPKVSRDLTRQVQDGEVERARALFVESVKRQLVSDVPVGTCLSGGIDSSSVVCIVKRIHPKGSISTGRQIKTFSSVFPGDSVDESQYARAVCEETQAEANLVTSTAEELWSDLPALVRCQEEPFVGTTVYSQWRVMRLAKDRGITVLLDGQGADELLAGYEFYYLSYVLTLVRNGSLPIAIEEALLSRDLTMPWVFRMIARLMQGILQRREISEVVTRGPLDDLAGMLETDVSKTSLPSLLRYEDKSSMWYSIEARVPFLDRWFFEYVASLPLDRKLHKGWTKYIFRQAMKGILPDSIRLRRDKRAFDTPEARWLVELRERLVRFFSDPNLVATKFYDADVLEKILKKRSFTEGDCSRIWRALNLELWYREFFPGRSIVTPDRTSVNWSRTR